MIFNFNKIYKSFFIFFITIFFFVSNNSSFQKSISFQKNSFSNQSDSNSIIEISLSDIIDAEEEFDSKVESNQSSFENLTIFIFHSLLHFNFQYIIPKSSILVFTNIPPPYFI